MELAGTTIGIVGGTGALGSGLAYRWAKAGASIIIGSRRPDAAVEVALSISAGIDGQGAIRGTSIEECAQQADIVVMAVPWAAHNESTALVAPFAVNKIILDVVSPLMPGKGGLLAIRVDEGSACQAAQMIAPESTIVGGFHHVSAVKLSDVNLESVESDVMLVGDEPESVERITHLVQSIPGMRAVYAGKLAVAAPVEGLTANLIAVNRRYKTNAGVRVTGI